MNVVMIGGGYVELVSGACCAEFGAEVTCVDVDERKIARLKERDPDLRTESQGPGDVYEPEHMSARGFQYAGVGR